MVLQASKTDKLKTNFGGQLLQPGDEQYDEARSLWNGMFDRHPAVIARCTSSQDVVRALEFGRAEGLTIAVHSGGHSLSGKSMWDDALVIDLALMKDLRVDTSTKTAVAGAGLKLGEFTRGLQEHGMATTMGIAGTTGIAGLTLGGGLGWLMGKYGLAIDNLLAAEVVTAAGEILTVSAQENEDLFWAIRGGGGNFGIVTSFTYRVHELAQVFGGLIAYPADRAREILGFYRDFSASAPDELTIYCGFLTAPDGNPVVAIAGGYAGDLEEAAKVCQPMKDLGPALDAFGPMPYTALQDMLDAAFPWGIRDYTRSQTVNSISDEAVEVLVKQGNSRPCPLAALVLEHVHGAAARVEETATAFPNRREHYDIVLHAGWEEASDDATNIQWVRDTHAALAPFATGDIYSNDVGDEDQALIPNAYGVNFQRLRELKRKWDADNVFRLNVNITPS